MRYTSALWIGLFSMALVGVGCAKRPPVASGTKPVSNTQPKPFLPSNTPPVVTFEAGGDVDRAANRELDQIMKSFHATKSFRMRFTAPSPQGAVATQLEFLRPNRFRGTLTMGSQPATEIIVVEDSLYMRSRGSSWIDLSGTASSKAVGDALKNSLTGNQSIENVGVDENARVKKVRDTARGCDRYSSTLRGADGNPISLDICAVDGYPHFVDITTSNGPLTYEYYDYNTLFLIEKPL